MAGESSTAAVEVDASDSRSSVRDAVTHLFESKARREFSHSFTDTVLTEARARPEVQSREELGYSTSPAGGIASHPIPAGHVLSSDKTESRQSAPSSVVAPAIDFAFYPQPQQLEFEAPEITISRLRHRLSQLENDATPILAPYSAEYARKLETLLHATAAATAAGRPVPPSHAGTSSPTQVPANVTASVDPTGVAHHAAADGQQRGTSSLLANIPDTQQFDLPVAGAGTAVGADVQTGRSAHRAGEARLDAETELNIDLHAEEGSSDSMLLPVQGLLEIEHANATASQRRENEVRDAAPLDAHSVAAFTSHVQPHPKRLSAMSLARQSMDSSLSFLWDVSDDESGIGSNDSGRGRGSSSPPANNRDTSDRRATASVPRGNVAADEQPDVPPLRQVSAELGGVRLNADHSLDKSAEPGLNTDPETRSRPVTAPAAAESSVGHDFHVLGSQRMVLAGGSLSAVRDHVGVAATTRSPATALFPQLDYGPTRDAPNTQPPAVLVYSAALNAYIPWGADMRDASLSRAVSLSPVLPAGGATLDATSDAAAIALEGTKLRVDARCGDDRAASESAAMAASSTTPGESTTKPKRKHSHSHRRRSHSHAPPIVHIPPPRLPHLHHASISRHGTGEGERDAHDSISNVMV